MARPKSSPEAQDLADLAALIARMRAGERRAVSRAVTELERLSLVAPRLLEAMQSHLGHALVIGFTGPPGAGKSTLINAYTRHLRGERKSVGIIAVDPSSPISGGAILGDRIRMTATLDDDGVFMRSLASRGHLGGLTPAAVRVIDALDAAGKDTILLETVGTGQTDDIQAMKAGLLEIADILVVNKADREGAERTLQQLKGALSLKSGAGGKVPALKVTAATGEGVAALAAAIEDIGARSKAGDPQVRRRRRARYLIARAAADLVADRIRAGSGRELDKLADAVLAGTLLPADAAKALIER
jgi:LAO/AO transport system kinase